MNLLLFFFFVVRKTWRNCHDFPRPEQHRRGSLAFAPAFVIIFIKCTQWVFEEREWTIRWGGLLPRRGAQFIYSAFIHENRSLFFKFFILHSFFQTSFVSFAQLGHSVFNIGCTEWWIDRINASIQAKRCDYVISRRTKQAFIEHAVDRFSMWSARSKREATCFHFVSFFLDWRQSAVFYRCVLACFVFTMFECVAAWRSAARLSDPVSLARTRFSIFHFRVKSCAFLLLLGFLSLSMTLFLVNNCAAHCDCHAWLVWLLRTW